MLKLLPFLLLLVSCTPIKPLELADVVIGDQQIWQGEVHIRGVVRVTRQGSLTILPGTKIFFEPVDLDGDGIGDSELRIEGELLARGTAEQPILLTSAASKPQPGDWKYLYFDYARKADLQYLISEYAYSGVQIHFCRARIANSEFRYNVDGVRFSTANISLTYSYLHHNRHGIRYEERGGKGVVRYNQISANQIGIFAVTRSAGKTLFELNDIIENRSYQIKMGLQQSTTLDFPRNWWGDGRGLSDETVFDQQRDPALGRVTGSDPLSQPVKAIRRMKESGQ